MGNTKTKSPKRHKAMRLSVAVIEQIEEIAVKNNRNFTNMVEVILSEYAKENRK